MEILKGIAIVVLIILIISMTFGIIWALMTISFWIGIPITLLVAVFMVLFILKIASRA